MAIGIGISPVFKKKSGQSWSSLYYYLKSGDTWYRRERNTAGGYFILWYSPDAGVTWEELLNLDITESDPVIDLIHQYRHRIVDYEYHVDQTLTATGYAGTEGVDWENLAVYNGWTSYWTTQTLLKYTERSSYDITEEGGKNAKILPSVGILKATDYIRYAVANFESGDTDGYIEARFYFAGGNDFTPIWGSCDELATGSDRYFYLCVYNAKPYLYIRSNSGTVFQNVCTPTDTIAAGWHTVRWTSSGGAYALTVDGVSKTFSVGGTGGANNGRWINLVPLRDNVTIGCLALAGGAGVVNFVPPHSNTKIDYVDYNNKHKWIVTGAGNYVFDIIGTMHLTWTGISHQSYDVLGSTLLLDSGYSVYFKTGDPNEYVPYKSGSPYDVSAFLSTYEEPINYSGSATKYNYAPSLIDFDYNDTADSDLDIFDKSNATIHIATAGMNYYDAANKYRWRYDELHPAIYSTAYKNVGYKGMMMAKATVMGGIPRDISEIYVLKSDQTGNKEWKLAELCTVQDLAQQSGGLPVYGANDYLTFFFSMSSYPDIVGDGVTDDYAAIQGMIDATPIGTTIRLGDSLSDVYLISQPIYFRSNRNYIIDGEIKIMDGETDVVVANINTGDQTFRATTPSKFKVGQWVSVTDDNYTLDSEGTPTVRGLRYAWGGKVTDITGDVITLEGLCPVNLTTAANAVCGHSQGCVILDQVSNITISGSGKLNGNRYNQIAVLPSNTNDLLGYWENQRCAMGLVIFQCDNVTVEDITVEYGLVHGVAVSALSSGWSTDITLSNVKANGSHDKNFLIRFTDGIVINDCSADGNPDDLVTPTTWEDGLIFYSNCQNCEVNRFTATENRRHGFAWNGGSCTGLVATYITTIANATRTGFGVEIQSEEAVLSNLDVRDSMRIGGVYTTNDVTVSNVAIVSNNPSKYTYLFGISSAARVAVTNLTLNNSQSSSYSLAFVDCTDCGITNGGVYNHTGSIISQAYYDEVVWTNFTGLVIS